ncbi:MAG: translation elongation factor-like protein [Candidatus Altiarchaeota archaeon]
MAEEEIGEVFSYFSKVGVAAVKLTGGELNVGDTVRIKGAKTDFTMHVESMQVDRDPVETASAGQSIGIKVPEKVRGSDIVYKVVD